jgi:hypothetical protein
LIASITLIIAFATLMGSAQILEAVGDPAAASVCRYVALGLGILWFIGQVLLLLTLAMGAIRQVGPAGPLTGYAAEEPEVRDTFEDEGEQALPPRG